MLYQGNFSYTDMTEDGDNYCLMPCVCVAESPDEALEKFRALLGRMKETSDLLAGATQVFLDSLVELPDTPTEAVACAWTKVVPHTDGLYSITSALPDAGGQGSAYAYVDDEEIVEEYIDSEWVPVNELDMADLDALEQLDAEAGDESAEEADELPFMVFDVDKPEA